MKGMYWILNEDHTVRPTDDVMEWAKSLENGSRYVARDTIGGLILSTVFLGLDYSFDEGATPLLFETTLFDGEMKELECLGSETYDQAMYAHVQIMVKLIDRFHPNWLHERGYFPYSLLVEEDNDMAKT